MKPEPEPKPHEIQMWACVPKGWRGMEVGALSRYVRSNNGLRATRASAREWAGFASDPETVVRVTIRVEGGR